MLAKLESIGKNRSKRGPVVREADMRSQVELYVPKFLVGQRLEAFDVERDLTGSPRGYAATRGKRTCSHGILESVVHTFVGHARKCR